MAWINLSGKRPTNLGAREGKLSACPPQKSNCVCSQYKESEQNLGPHYVQPLTYEGNVGDAMTRVIAVLMQQPGCTIVTYRPDYIHAEFRSAKLGFVDDVEFLSARDDQVIHLRSASRLGLSVFGVTRVTGLPQAATD